MSDWRLTHPVIAHRLINKLMNHHQICANSLLSNILFIFRVHYVVHLCKKDRVGPAWMGMVRIRSLYLGHCCTLKVLFGEKERYLEQSGTILPELHCCALCERINRTFKTFAWEEGNPFGLNVHSGANMLMEMVARS